MKVPKATQPFAITKGAALISFKFENLRRFHLHLFSALKWASFSTEGKPHSSSEFSIQDRNGYKLKEEGGEILGL
ncbi:UNVERIFIED_CONTAM: hypothetical protein Sindi_2109200 [Sesamum indicum]